MTSYSFLSSASAASERGASLLSEVEAVIEGSSGKKRDIDAVLIPNQGYSEVL
jgi:hypothetical protein